MISYSTKCSAIIRFVHEIWGGGVMYLVYGSSSSSSYMDCMVFFGDECHNLDGLEFVNPVLLHLCLRR